MPPKDTAGIAKSVDSDKIACLHMSLVLRKPVFEGSDQVRYKPGCTAIEDGYRLEISDYGSKGIVLSV